MYVFLNVCMCVWMNIWIDVFLKKKYLFQRGCRRNVFIIYIMSSIIYSATKIFVNGCWVGIHRDPDQLMTTLKRLRRQMDMIVSEVSIWHVNIGVILCWKFPRKLMLHSVKKWLAGQNSVKSTAHWWVILENNEKATLNINMPYLLQLADKK